MDFSKMYPWVKGIVKDENGQSRLDGAGSTVIEMLSRVMNFTYEFYGGSDLEYGSFTEENQSWSGVGGLMQQKVVDMQFAWTRDILRTIRIAPSREFYNFNTKMLASVGDLEAVNFIAFVAAFDVTIWYCVFTLIVISLFISAGSDALYLNRINKKGLWKKEFLHNFWLYLSALFSEGSVKTPHSVRSQALLGLWLLTILVLSNGFSSQFKAILMSNKEEPRIRNIKDLTERPHLIPYLAQGSIYEFAFKLSDLEERTAVYRRALKQPREAFISLQDLTKVSQYQKVKSGYGVTFADDLWTRSVLTSICDQLQGNRRLYLGEEDITPFPGTIGFRDDVSPCWFKKINDRIQWMVEADIFTKMANEETWKYKKCEDKTEGSNPGLEMKHLMPVFVFIGILHLFAFFVFCLEMIHHKCTVVSI